MDEESKVQNRTHIERGNFFLNFLCAAYVYQTAISVSLALLA